MNSTSTDFFFFQILCTELQGLTTLEADAASSFPLLAAHVMCETPEAQTPEPALSLTDPRAATPTPGENPGKSLAPHPCFVTQAHLCLYSCELKNDDD